MRCFLGSLSARNLRADMKSLDKNTVLDGSFKKVVVWALVLLPLVGAFPGLSAVKLYIAGFYFPSQFIFVAAGAFVAAAIWTLAKREVPVLYRKAGTLFGFLFLLFLLWGVISAVCGGKSLAPVFVQALWLLVPALYGFCVVGIVVNRLISAWDFLFDAVVLFAAFSLILVVYNIGAYGASFPVNRLYCPGLGSVISGYTFAFAVAVAFFLKHQVEGRRRIMLAVSVVVLLVAVFWTGSRGGVYPALVMAALFFLPKDNAAALVLLMLGCLIVSLLFDPLGYLLSGRMGNFESGRYSTWSALLGLLGDGGLEVKALGFGLGNLFPYQQWFASYSEGAIVRGYTDGAWNHFTFQGVSLLVQPHNSLLWLFGECGFIGIVLVLSLYFWMIAKPRASTRMRVGFAAVALTFILLNCFDSVAYVNMACATWWLLLFLSFYLLTSERCSRVGDCSH